MNKRTTVSRPRSRGGAYSANRRQNGPLVAAPEPAWKNISVLPFSPAEITLKRLLVPVDFSNSSRKALQYAVSFAKCFNSGILLVHAVQALPPATPLSFPGETIADIPLLEEQGAKHLALWQKSVEENVPATVRIEVGNPSEIILRAAREDGTELIIMGTHGYSGLKQIFMGGTARKVVRNAPCPVLVVREQEHDFLIPFARRFAESKFSAGGISARSRRRSVGTGR